VELKPAGGEVIVRGSLAGGPWSATFEAPATLPEGVAGLPLGAFFGREQAIDLEAEGVRGERMRDVGLRHRIVTHETSLVAISEDVTVDPRDPRRVEKLAVELPAGVSAEGVGIAPGWEDLRACLDEGSLSLVRVAPTFGLPAASAATRGGFLQRLLGKRGALLPSHGRVVRIERNRLVIEFTVEKRRFSLGTPRRVELRFDDLTLEGTCVPEASTRPGPCPLGSTVRLVIDAEEEVPAQARLALLVVEMSGESDLILVIEDNRA
jgi:hypothetical protein